MEGSQGIMRVPLKGYRKPGLFLCRLLSDCQKASRPSNPLLLYCHSLGPRDSDLKP